MARKVINFGTSAYLKVLALNPKPRDTELRKRNAGVQTGGYDFHKTMRRIAAAYVTGRLSLEETQSEFNRIANVPERKSAIEGVNQLIGWLRGRSAEAVSDERRVLSPGGYFSVRFAPDIAVNVDGQRTLIHLWNTKHPKLTTREAMGTLGLFMQGYADTEIGILCLRTKHLYATSEHTKAEELARLLAMDVERRIISDDPEERERLIAIEQATRH